MNYMGKPLTTDNIGEYFADAFREVVLPGLNNLTSDVDELKVDMKDVKKRLGGVEDGLEDVKKDMATKDDLKKLEDTLTKRMDRMNDVQSNLNERVEALESESPVVFA